MEEISSYLNETGGSEKSSDEEDELIRAIREQERYSVVKPRTGGSMMLYLDNPELYDLTLEFQDKSTLKVLRKMLKELCPPLYDRIQKILDCSEVQTHVKLEGHSSALRAIIRYVYGDSINFEYEHAFNIYIWAKRLSLFPLSTASVVYMRDYLGVDGETMTNSATFLLKKWEKIQNELDITKVAVSNLRKDIIFVAEKKSKFITMHKAERQNRYSRGIHHQVPLATLKELGFKVVYHELYSHITTRSELQSIHYAYGGKEKICVGSVESASPAILHTCAFGLVSMALQNTQSTNRAVFHKGAYWYFVGDMSFGYSPVQNINLEECWDTTDRHTDEQRMCWPVRGKSYDLGYRIGTTYSRDKKWHKYILVADNLIQNEIFD